MKMKTARAKNKTAAKITSISEVPHYTFPKPVLYKKENTAQILGKTMGKNTGSTNKAIRITSAVNNGL